MLEKLKQETLQANLDLVKYGLVLFTWGNVSVFDAKTRLMVIKPSGVPYEKMRKEDMVVVDLEGKTVEGEYKPSSDMATHVELYKEFRGIRAIVHTHSKWATAWAQACLEIPVLGTTHADNFFGDIPCTRNMTDEEIHNEYEKNTGLVIIETLKKRKIDPLELSAVIVANHGPFSWGTSPEKAVKNAAVMEYAAEMAYITTRLNPNALIPGKLIKKHYMRKHGENAYYGQSV